MRTQDETNAQRTVLRATAPGKVILCGEHAVVYGRPAIAVPVHDVRAEALFRPHAHPFVEVHLPDLGERWRWPPGRDPHPLSVVLARLSERAGRRPQGVLTIRSTIPIAGGMGSSAAVAVAAVRVLAQALGLSLTPADVSALAYEAEVITHGTPSGVDNTVIAYEQAVWFVRGRPPEPFPLAAPMTLVIGDTGVRAATREVVAAVRRAWEQDRARYEALFDAIASVVVRVREALQAGRVRDIGPLLDENHRLLQALGVSSPELDRLVAAARAAGAWGAKLAGAGRGGNMIALTDERLAPTVAQALHRVGARATWITTLQPGERAYGGP